MKVLDLFFRSIAARVRTKHQGRDALQDFVGDEQFEILKTIDDLILKAATNPANTTVAGWAQELVGALIADFALALRPGLFGALSDQTLGMTFDGGPLPRIPSRSATPTVNGSFVGEGQPVPVRRPTTTAITLTPKKLAVISSYTAEMAKSSAIESVLRSLILQDSRATVDSALTDATAADAIRPPGLRAGLSSLSPSAATGSYDRMVADIKALLAAIAPVYRPALLVNAAQAVSLQWMSMPGTPPDVASGILTFVSPAIPANTVLALDMDAFCWAADVPGFSFSDEAVIHEESSTPLPIVSGAGPTAASLADVAAPSRSFFQTATTGLLMVWPISWSLLRANGAAFVSGVTW